MNKSFFQQLNTGKNPKFPYYIKGGLRSLVPPCLCRSQLAKLLSQAEKRDDYDYIRQRVDYYNRLKDSVQLPASVPALANLSLKSATSGSVYFFDSYEIARYFPSRFQCSFLFGDITKIPSIPSIVKSRPIAGDNSNSVLLKLDKVRHFIFLNDKIPFEKKQNKVIFRGKIGGKTNRQRFMELYCKHPLCNAGDIGRHANPAWLASKKTLYEHLDYKFIMALEGNDVASNLKWIMSSNSIAVMPRPTYETWFMEGTLIPNYHYIEIQPDFSDLEERLNYYINHPEETQQIIENAHRYVAPFKDKKREKIIALMVLQKYFNQTNQ